MATGIISTGTFLLGPLWLSRALLAAASAGLVVLGAALVIRLALFRSSVAADIQAPDRVFGFFTIVAGIDVFGVRLAAAGHPLVTAILASLAAAVWLVLTYGVPASLLLTRNRDSVLGGVNGAWLLWVVGTQSLSVTASTLVPAWPSQSGLLAPAAVGLWSVGLVLYLLLVSLILLRWLTVPMTPETLGPPYWILMGATAITVLAGARILALPAALPVARATAGFVEGFSFVLWAFGTWWIPLLIVLGLWRHLRRHWPLTYEPTLWSVVFPLGMYSVATLSFGKAARLAFMEPLARFMLWVAVAAWVLVAAAFVARLARHPGQPHPARQRPQPLPPPRHNQDAPPCPLTEAGWAGTRPAPPPRCLRNGRATRAGYESRRRSVRRPLMSLTFSSGPLSGHAPATVNYRIDGPAHKLLMHEFPRRVRATFGGETVFDTIRAMLVHETGLLPQVYVPQDDIRADLLQPTDHHTYCPFKGTASYWSVTAGGQVAENAIWAYPDPNAESRWLQGYAGFYWDAMDEWYDEDERVEGHMRDPYHRVDVRRSSRPVRVLLGDTVLAETRRPLLLSETGLPNRFYIPQADVRRDLLEESDTHTVCPYKGTASYWTVSAGGRKLADAVWSYPRAEGDAAAISGYQCFLHDELTTEVGQPG